MKITMLLFVSLVVLFVVVGWMCLDWACTRSKNVAQIDSTQIKVDRYEQLIKERDSTIEVMRDSLANIQNKLEDYKLLSKEYENQLTNLRFRAVRLPHSVLQDSLTSTGERLVKGGY